MKKLVIHTACRDVSSNDFSVDAIKSVYAEIMVPDIGTNFNTDTIALKAMVESNICIIVGGIVTKKDKSIIVVDGPATFNYWGEALDPGFEVEIKTFDL